MWDFSILRAVGLVLRTWPFTVLRLMVFLGLTAAYVGATSAGAGIGWGIGHVGSTDFKAAATFWGGLAGFGAVSFWLWTLREYLTWMIVAGHVAALTIAFEGRPLPSGREQIAFAIAAVKARFAEVHALFVLDQLVKGAVGAVTRTFEGLAAFAGAPGLDGLVRLASAVLRMSTTFLDELVLARALIRRSDDAWGNARDSIVLYAQNAGPVLKNAVWLTVFRFVGTVVLFVVLLAPAGALVWFAPGAATGWTMLFALGLAVGLRAAVIDPFCIAALMQTWFTRIEGQRPDPAWETRLEEVSSQFRDLGARAREAFGGRTPG